MVRFGPSGNQQLFYDQKNKSSLDAPKWLNNLGLSAYEYSFSRGINIKEETATSLGQIAKEYNIELSVHAPYYINFANQSEEMIEKSIGYITKGLHFLNLMGSKRYIVHIGSCTKLERSVAIASIKKNLKRAIDEARKQNLLGDIKIMPETMGKVAQIGTWEEIIDICTIDECLVPCFDVGHINALSLGTFNTYEQYKQMFDYAFEKLGERVRFCHVHFSKIEFGPKGEVRHLNYDDEVYGPNFDAFGKIVKEYNLEPVIICESKDFMATDALIMKEIFEKL